MRDRSITNWFGENLDEQQKRRKWLENVYDNAKSKEPSILDKAGYMANGAIQGLSLGYGDEIEGAISGLGYGLASLNSNWNKNGESFRDAFSRGYQQYRDNRRNQLSEGKEKAPMLTNAAEIVGSTLSPFNKIGAASVYAPRSVQMAKAGKVAVRNGMINGVGSETDGTLGSQLSGLGTGAVNGFIGNLAGKASSPLGKRFFMDKNRRGLSDGLFENIGGKGSDAFIEKLRNIFKL